MLWETIKPSIGLRRWERGRHGITSKTAVIIIVTTVRTSNPIYKRMKQTTGTYYRVNLSMEPWKSRLWTALSRTCIGSYSSSHTLAFGTYIPCCMWPLASKFGAL
jgi:hypothetical protein